VKLHILRVEQRLPIAVDQAWDFLSDPRNLPRITPPSMGFRITSDLPGRMYAGMIVVYRVSPMLGVPLTWVTEITQVEEPRFFVDEQRFGPYRFWHHQHHLRPVPGGTEMRDIVHYALPRLPGAGVARALIVGPQLRRIFEFRRRVLEERFGTLPE
jgi:ligand-binding SRPBCC domain-containing protein